MNAVERKESETPSTPCSSMTPSLEASPIGVSTTASILSQALHDCIVFGLLTARMGDFVVK